MAASEDLSRFLKGLQTQAAGVRAAFLSSSQGSFLASTEISGVEKVRLGAISAASMAIASKAADDLQLGSLGQVHIAGDDASIVLLRVGGKAVLTLVVEDHAKLSDILHEAKRAIVQLAPKV
jgi:predicted regulator of Ras-like GTPase activity (Roadblock/LC7/MglB family)